MQGGLIGLAAATVGLASEAAQHLEVQATDITMNAYEFTRFELEIFLPCLCFLKLVGFHVVQKIVPPVLNSFTDQDSRVRYYACEALYNISKVSLGFEFMEFKCECMFRYVSGSM
jgi:vacuole morphology and inheritance protein 14